jgi:hypothetical protein
MLTQYRVAWALMAVAVLLGTAGCATTATTARTTGEYVDDARIAADVRTKLLTDPTLNGSSIAVTSSDGVVYLSGTAPSSNSQTRATQLAREVAGVRSVVNNMVVATSPPAVATATAAPPPKAVVAPPVNIVTGQPAIDATGVVAQYDPQTGIIIFQDGRMVRVTTESAVGAPASVVALQPGTQVMLRNVQPVGYQPTMVPAPGSWRMATVSHVDTTNSLIFLTDGSVVHAGPSTVLRSGTQPITLAQLQPGSQIAISVPATVAATPAPMTGSALPRQTVVPQETPEIRIFTVPR